MYVILMVFRYIEMENVFALGLNSFWYLYAVQPHVDCDFDLMWIKGFIGSGCEHVMIIDRCWSVWLIEVWVDVAPVRNIYNVL